MDGRRDGRKPPQRGGEATQNRSHGFMRGEGSVGGWRVTVLAALSTLQPRDFGEGVDQERFSEWRAFPMRPTGEIERPPQVFLSHSSRDKPSVRKLKEELERRNVSSGRVGFGRSPL